VVSKAFSMSKNTVAIDILLFKFRVTWSVSLINCSVMLWRAWKPNWGSGCAERPRFYTFAASCR
jgi:hypothetical protein